MISSFSRLVFSVLLTALLPLHFSARAQQQDPPPPPAAPAAPATPPPPADAPNPAVPEAPSVPAPPAPPEPRHQDEYSFHQNRRHDTVKIGTDFTLRAGETNYDVVVVWGTATIDGTLLGDLVVVGGKAIVNGTVRGDMVSVLGSAKLGPNAKVKRDAVVVAGVLERAEGAEIGGEPVEINSERIPGLMFATGWLTKGLLMGRPLPHQIGMAWVIAGIFFLINLLLAVMFSKPVKACVEGAETKPLTAFFTGVLTMLLLAPVIALLGVSIVGLLAVPFVLCAIVIAFLLGKVVVYQYAGMQFGRQLHMNFLQLPLVALLLGTTLFYVLYAIPVIGFIVWGVISVFGLGAVVLTAVSNFRRENERPMPPAGPSSGNIGGGDPGFTNAPVGEMQVNQLDAAHYPRVGFWRRLGATFLDLIMVMTITVVTHQPPIGIILWCVYHIVMWTWKGTTIGGIVAGIKIVRLDGRPIDFGVALVRFLSTFFSTMVFFIGFFWAGWSREKRAWHDIIAGTIVVKVPKGLSLI